MTLIVAGQGLGLFNSSLNVLGSFGPQGNAALGRSGEQVLVNASSGNLVIRNQDEYLASAGLDAAVVRTYNSQGQFDGDNDDQWRLNVASLVLSGTANQTGSSVKKTFGDGSEATYTFDNSSGTPLYLSTDGDGAHDTLTYGASRTINSTPVPWMYTDGSTQSKEYYNAAGQLIFAQDTDGNTQRYSYTNNRIATIADLDASGTVLQSITVTYDTTNTTLISSVSVTSGGSSTTRVRYEYDTVNRLSQVIVSLDPADASKTYVTHYTYDGASKRIASITTGAGETLNFTYVQLGAGGPYLIKTTTDGQNNVTTFEYGSTTIEVPITAQATQSFNYNKTDVIGPLGTTTYVYDTKGRLIQVQAPSVNNQRSTTTYGYDAQDNVTSVTDANGARLDFTYDAAGNRLSQRDALGNTITYTYSSRNQLLSETRYKTPDPDGAGIQTATKPLTTRYVYDSEDHLRFNISAEGRVTEHRYNTAGHRETSITYTAATYDAQTLPSDLATLVAWATAIADKTQAQRVDYGYDFRGQLQTQTTYATLNADGTGLDSSKSVTSYIYDARGLLLQSIDARGTVTTGVPNDYLTSYTYDGLGRVLTTSTTNELGNIVSTTTLSYDDVGNRVLTTAANGLITSSSYDKRGLLTATTQMDSATPLGVTTYSYDTAGRLRITQDPTGVQTYRIYDAANRLVGQVDGTWALTQLDYDPAGNVIRTTAYSVQVPQGHRWALQDPNGMVTIADLMTVPAFNGWVSVASDDDRVSHALYDDANRLVYSVDADGAITENIYDGAGRITDVIQYATLLTAAQRQALKANPAPAAGDLTVIPNAGEDRRTRHFYDNDGQHLGSLDGEGYFTAHTYDASGQLIKTQRYATALGDAAPPAIGTWSGAQPISATGGVENAQSGMDAQGNVHVVWSQADGGVSSIYTNRYDAIAGRWTGAQPLELGVGNAMSPAISVAANGSAVAVWSQRDGGTMKVYLKRYNAATQAWETLPPPEFGVAAYVVSNTRVALNQNGDVAVAWDILDATFKWKVGSSVYRTATGQWVAMPLADGMLDSRVAIDAQGNATVVWAQASPDYTAIRAYGSRFDAATGVWGDATALTPYTAGNTYSPNIAISASGDVFIAWAQTDDRNKTYVKHYNPATQLWDTQVVGDYTGSGESRLGIQLATDANGNVVIAWSHWDGTGTPGNPTRVAASAYDSTANQWLPSQYLDVVPSTGTTAPPVVSMQKTGQALVVWEQRDTASGAYSVMSRQYDLDARRWGDIAPLENSAQTAEGSAVTTDQNGNALVTWMQFDGVNWSIVANRYQAKTLATDGSFAQITAALTAANSGVGDQITHAFYNARGQQVAMLETETAAAGTSTSDTANFLTEYEYDLAGNRTVDKRYATNANAYTGTQTVAQLRPSASLNDQVTTTAYTALNQTATITSTDGTVTKYSYDSVGNLIRTDRALGTPEIRTTQARYDLRNRLIQELTAEGSAALEALLTSNPSATQLQIDAIWAQYGLTHTYDAAGRRTSTRSGGFGAGTSVLSQPEVRATYVTPDWGFINQPRMELDNVGNGILIWQEAETDLVGNSRVNLFTRRAQSDGTWGDKIQLNDAAATGYVLTSEVQVAKDGAGNFAVVWLQTDDQGTDRLFLKYYTNGSGWGDAMPIGEGVRLPAMSMDNTGRIALLWVKASYNADFTQYGPGVYAQTYSPTQGLSTVTPIVTALPLTPSGISVASVAFDASGNAIATWSQETFSDITSTYTSQIHLSRYSAVSGLWSVPELVEERPNVRMASIYEAGHPNPEIAVDAAGNAIIVWEEQILFGPIEPTSVYAKRYDATLGQWQTTRTLVQNTNMGARGARPHIAMDAQGNATLVWTQYASGNDYELHAQRYDATQGWMGDETLSTGLIQSNAQVRIDANGTTTVVWIRDAVGAGVYATHHVRNQGWTGIELVEASGASFVRAPAITVNNQGEAFATWLRQDISGIGVPVYVVTSRVELAPASQNSSTTWFYYDNASRLVATLQEADNGIDITNQAEIKQTTYNAFGQADNVRRYSNRIDTAQNLTGGLIDQPTAQGSIRNQIELLRNNSTDSQASTLYTRRGQTGVTIDGENYQTQNQYNAFGDLTQKIQQIAQPGSVLKLVADAQGAANAVEHQYQYDKRGVQTKIIWDPTGLNTQESHKVDAFGRRSEHTDANGNTTQYQYDKLGRVITVTDPTNAKRVTTYDAFNRMLTQTDALGNSTTTSYDEQNRKVTVTTAEGVQTITTRNRHGQTVQVTDGNTNTNTTTYNYDVNGNLTQITDANNNVIEHNSYDPAGRKLTVTDGNGNVTRFDYDAASRVLRKVVDPQTGGLNLTTEYHYDGQGRATIITIGKGTADESTTQTIYDRNGRAASVIVDPKSINPGGLDITTTYAYDGRGNTVLVTEGAGTLDAKVTQYVYDSVGRRTQEIVDPFGLKITTEYKYDNHGNVIAKIDAEKHVTRYVYDADNRLVYTINGTGAVSKSVYDSNGRVISNQRYNFRVTDSATATTISLLPYQLSQADVSALIQSYWEAPQPFFGFPDNATFYATTTLSNGEYVATWIQPEGSAFRLYSSYSTDRVDWTANVAVSDTFFYADQVQVITDRSGNAMLVWQQQTDVTQSVVIQASYFDANTKQWGGPQPIGTGVMSLEEISRSASFSPNGDAYVGYMSMGTAFVRRYEVATKTWVDPVPLTIAGGVASTPPSVVFDSNGNGLAVWTANISGIDRVYSAQYNPVALGWATPQSRDIGAQSASVPQVAYDRLGNAFVVWVQGDGATYSIFATRYDAPTQTWSSPVAIETGSGAADKPRIAINPFGNATITLWRQAEDAVSTVYLHANQYVIGQGWQGAQKISTIAFPQNAQVAFDASGAINVLWEKWISDTETDIYLQRYVEGEGWLPAQRLGGAAPAARSNSRLLVGVDGGLSVLWSESETFALEDGSTQTIKSIYSQSYISSDDVSVVTRYAYDRDGRLRYTIDAEGAVTETAYDKAGNVVQTVAYATPVSLAIGQLDKPNVSDHLDIIPELQLNSLQKDEAKDQKRVTVYDKANRVAFQIDAEGNIAELTYDAAGNLRTTKSYAAKAGGAFYLQNPSLATYDNLRLLADGIASPLNDETSRAAIDRAGRQKYIIDALGYVTEYVYNATGRVATKIEYDAKINVAALDATVSIKSVDLALKGRVQASVDLVTGWVPKDRITTFVYDDAGRITQQTGAAQSPDETVDYYDYDGRGQVIAHRNGRGSTEYFAYNSAGDLQRKIDYVGNVVDMQYDAMGRRTLETTYMNPVTLPSSAVLNPRWAYEAPNPVPNSDLIKGDRIVEYKYDAMGRMTEEIHYDKGILGANTDIWNAPEFVSQGPEGGAYPPQARIARDGKGNAIAVWQQRMDPAGVDFLGSRIWANRYIAGEGWQGPTLIGKSTSSGLGREQQPQIGMDQNGNAIVVWEDSVENISYNRFTNGVWQGPQLLETFNDGPVGSPSIGMDPAGNAVTIWIHYTFKANLYARRYENGTLLPAELVTGNFGTNLIVDSSFDANGNPVIAWSSDSGVFLSFFRAGSWQTQTVATIPPGTSPQVANDYDVGLPRVVVDKTQDIVTVVWSQFTPEKGVSELYTWRATLSQPTGSPEFLDFGVYLNRTAGPRSSVAANLKGEIVIASGSTVYRLTATGWKSQSLPAGATQPRVAIDNTGNAVVVYLLDHSLYAQTYIAGDGWQSAQLLEHYDEEIWELDMNMGADGGVTVLWKISDGRQWSYYSSELSAITTTQSTTRFVYDALGNLTEKSQAGANERSRATYLNYDRRGRVIEESIAASVKRFAYDAFGNQTKLIDPRGVELADYDSDWALNERNALGLNKPVSATETRGLLASELTAAQREQLLTVYTTTQQFDRNNRKLAAVDPYSNTKSTTYDAFGNINSVTDSKGTGYFFYDAQNRIDVQVDPNGYVTRIVRDRHGNAVESIKYANPWADNSFSGANRPEFIQPGLPSKPVTYVEIDDAKDEHTGATYDELNRTTFVRDAENNTESFEYDDQGNIRVHIDKNNNRFEYDYDANGRRTVEKLPIKGIRVLDGAEIAVTNRYTYDAAGNLLSKLEAEGLKEQRETRYSYDRRNRLVATQLPPVKVYNPVTGVTSIVNPMTYREYDANNNLLVETDANGNRTIHYYDGANRRIATVDGAGFYHQFTYDAAGNVVTKRTYDERLVSSALPSVRPFIGPNAKYIETYYTYDANGREISVASMAEYFYNNERPDGERLYVDQSTTTKAYDGNGNLVWLRDGNENDTFYYYDRANRRIAQVDPLKYLTHWSYDGNGNVVSEARYDAAVTLENGVAIDQYTSVDVLQQRANLLQEDNGNRIRVTNYEYDRLNRRTHVRTPNVEYADAVGNTFVESTSGTATTTTEYDGEGNIRFVTGPGNLGTTEYRYDALSRQIQFVKPGFVDFEGATVKPTTTRVLNAHGAVVQEIREGKIDADDQKHQFEVGADGRVLYEIDAQGARIDYGHDAVGNIIVKKEQRTDADANLSDGIAPITRQITTRYAYDGVQRQTRTTDATGVVHNTAYDGHGRIVQQGTFTQAQVNVAGFDARTQGQVYFEYNRLGKVYKTNAENGSTRMFFYDRNGNTTLELHAVDKDLRNYSLAQVIDNFDNEIQLTISQFDALNRRTDVFQPPMSFTTGIESKWSNVEVTTPVPFTAGEVDLSLHGTFWAKQTAIMVTSKHPKTGGQVFDHFRYQISVNWSALTGWGDGIYEVETERDYTYIGVRGSVEKRTDKITQQIFNLAQTTHVEDLPDHALRTDTYGYPTYTSEAYGPTTVRLIKIVSGVRMIVAELVTQVPHPEKRTSGRNPQTIPAVSGEAQGSFKSPFNESIFFKKEPMGGPNDHYTMEISYHPASNASNLTRVTLSVERLGNGIDGLWFRWDLATTPLVGLQIFSLQRFTYLYSYVVKDNDGNIVNAASGTITGRTSFFSRRIIQLNVTHVHGVRENVVTVPQMAILGGANVLNSIHRRQMYNAFGEISAEIADFNQRDANGNLVLGVDGKPIKDPVRTDFYYNKLGLLIRKVEAAADYTKENGFVVKDAREATDFFYDLAGRYVGTRNALGFNTTQTYIGDQNGSTYMADGGVKSYQYDIFGNQRVWTDEVDRVTTYSYGRDNRVKSIKRPSTLTESFEYDEAGNRIAHTNLLGNRSRTLYDALGRVVDYYSYAKRQTHYDYAYDASIGGVGGYRKTTTDPNSDTLVANVDLFGRMRSMTDMGGHVYSYVYNAAGWLKHQTSNAGQDITYDYYHNGLLKKVSDSKINDGEGSVAYFEYDDNGNRIHERYTKYTNTSINPYQFSNIIYDKRNRITKVVDPRAEITYEYDAVGNRRYVKSYYHDGLNGSVQQQEHWYKYDALNRFKITMGQLTGTATRGAGAVDNASAVIDVGNGYEIAYYKSGERLSVRYAKGDNLALGYNLESYTYTPNGQLEHVYLNDTLAVVREHDAMGNVTKYIEMREPVIVIDQGGSGSDPADSGDPSARLLYRHVTNSGGTQLIHTVDYRNYYDADGVLYLTENYADGVADGSWTRYQDFDVNGNPIYLAENDPNFNNFAQMDRAGNPLLTRSRSLASDSTEILTATHYEYVKWDTKKKQNVKIRGWNESIKKWKPGLSAHEYDVNGHLRKVFDVGNNSELNPQHYMSYVTDHNGQIIRRLELLDGAVKNYHAYYYINGRGVGDVGLDPISGKPTGLGAPTDYAQILAQKGNEFTPGGGKGGNDSTINLVDIPYRVSPVNSADFDQNYQNISPTYPRTTVENYTVQKGDTLRSIALKVWGDSSLWYLIADANGIQNYTDPVEGTRLIIPGVVANIHNNAETFRPYNPGEIIGNTDPTLPQPPPPPGPDQCKVLLIIVIAVVVSAVSYGYLSGYMSLWAAGAIAAAAGSAASQYAAVQMGMQEDIRWRDVGLAAVVGGIGGAFGQAIKGTEYVGTWQAAIASNVMGQMVYLIAGEQDEFDWAGLAVAGIMAKVNAKLNESIPETNVGAATSTWEGFRGDMLRNVASGMISETARSVLIKDYQFQWASVAGNAIGNSLGNVIDSYSFGDRPSRQDERAQAAVAQYFANAPVSSDGPDMGGERDFPPSAYTPDEPSNRYKLRWENDVNLSALNMDPDVLTRNLRVSSDTEEFGPPKPYVVKSGDALERIAKQQLGNAGYWPLIAEANGISDPSRIQVGQRLRMPSVDGVDISQPKRLAGQYYTALADSKKLTLEWAAQANTENNLQLDIVDMLRELPISNVPDAGYRSQYQVESRNAMTHSARPDDFDNRTIQEHLSDAVSSMILGGDPRAEREYQYQEMLYMKGFRDTLPLEPGLAEFTLVDDILTGGVGGIGMVGGRRVANSTSVVRGTSETVTGSQWNEFLSAKYGADNVFWDWPKNRGFVYGADGIGSLQPGQLIGRLGSERGTFANPLGTAPETLSLRPGTDLSNLNVYRVIQEIPDVRIGPAAPAFDMPGYGTQYQFPYSVKELLNPANPFLERVTK